MTDLTFVDTDWFSPAFDSAAYSDLAYKHNNI